MSVIEEVKIYKNNVLKKNKKKKLFVLNQIACFGVGFLFSLAGFNKDFSPFGVAFAGSVTKNYTITATLGAALGYFVALDSVTALRYTASILALSVIMTALKSFKQLRENSLTPIVVTSVCLFVTSLAIAFSKEITITSLLICFSEGAIGGASAFVFAKSRAILTTKNGLSCATSKDVTAVLISLTLIILSINELNLFKIYPAHIIVEILILISAYYGREAGGAIVGICGGVAESLGSGNFHLLAFFAFGGLLGGTFSTYGRAVTFLGFLLSGLAVSVIAFDKSLIMPTIAELFVSGIIFLFVSKKYDSKLQEYLLPKVSSPIVDSVKFNIVKKLKKASAFSQEICESLNSVNNALSKNEKCSVNSIPQKVKQQVCSSCGLYDACWGEAKEQTEISFNELLNMKKEGKYLEYKSVPQTFASACIRTENVSSIFNKLYGQYKVNEKMETRIKEIHSLASEQFINISVLLDSLCDDINENISFDMDTAAKIRGVASNCGFEPLEICCTVNTLEKMVIEIEIKKPYDKTQIHSLGVQINILTGREMEIPETIDYENKIKLIYKEKAEYKVVSSGVQYNSNGQKYCGDTYTTFEDDKGYFYAAICDGMGTGTKAAISSSLAVTLLEKLIKAGFSVNSTIKTINTSLISKSGDEGSVTLDLLVFDLFTGRVEFYKCGASDTIVKRRGKVIDVGFDSLPLGILKDAQGDMGSGTLYSGDVVVMCSDGVREEDYYTLRNGVKNFSEGSVRNFVADISEKIRRMQPPKNDDMTVLALAITKNR